MSIKIYHGFKLKDNVSLNQFKKIYSSFAYSTVVNSIHSKVIENVIYEYDLKSILNHDTQDIKTIISDLLIKAGTQYDEYGHYTMTATLFIPEDSVTTPTLGILSIADEFWDNFLNLKEIEDFSYHATDLPENVSAEEYSLRLKTWESMIDVSRSLNTQGFNINPLTEMDRTFNLFWLQENKVKLPKLESRRERLITEILSREANIEYASEDSSSLIYKVLKYVQDEKRREAAHRQLTDSVFHIFSMEEIQSYIGGKKSQK